MATKWLYGTPLPVIRDLVNFAMPPGSTHADTIQRLAEETNHLIEGTLPETMHRIAYPRGKTIFDSATDAVMQILENHPDVGWNRSNGLWRFETRDARIHLSVFDEPAGRLVLDAPRGANGRILLDGYRQIARSLDKLGLKPRDWVEGWDEEYPDRKALAVWNQKHPREALDAFCKIVDRRGVKRGQFWKALRRRLHRAKAKYVEAHG
jgi:hypothetical protein